MPNLNISKTLEILKILLEKSPNGVTVQDILQINNIQLTEVDISRIVNSINCKHNNLIMITQNRRIHTYSIDKEQFYKLCIKGKKDMFQIAFNIIDQFKNIKIINKRDLNMVIVKTINFNISNVDKNDINTRMNKFKNDFERKFSRQIGLGHIEVKTSEYNMNISYSTKYTQVEKFLSDRNQIFISERTKKNKRDI